MAELSNGLVVVAVIFALAILAIMIEPPNTGIG